MNESAYSRKDITSQELTERERVAELLKELFEKVLSEWEGSKQELEFPEETIDKYGKIKGEFFSFLTKNSASHAIRDSIKEREILIVVGGRDPGPIFKAGRYQPMNFQEDDPRLTTAAFFPVNFFTRCQESGVNPVDAVEKCLRKLFYWEVKMKLDKTPYAIPELPEDAPSVLVLGKDISASDFTV